MCEGLSPCEVDSIYHHFNSRLEMRGANTSRAWVDTAQRKLGLVKSNAIVDLMNSTEPHQVVLETLKDDLEVCSIVSARVVEPLGATMVDTPPPICMKMSTPLPGTVKRAPEMFTELVSTLLGRSSLWNNCEVLRSKLYSCVYAGIPIPSAAEWSASTDGMSVSVTTLEGLQLKCAIMGHHTRARECGHRFDQRMMCQSVTATYTQQPMVFTVSCDGLSEVLSAHVYPSSNSSSGLLLGTVHASGFDKPFRSCAVVAKKTLRVHPYWGVHEADAITLTTPYARGHMHTIANIFTKSCIMKAVLGDLAPEFKVSRLGDMDELELLSQYKTLRGTLSGAQHQTCSEIWKDSCVEDGSGGRASMRVRCVSGTLDCFKKDDAHTDMALHTRNVIATCFNHDGIEHNVSSPLVLSMYGTYYHR